MKLNVDALNLIQLCFTLSDPSGNLPHLVSSDLLFFAREFNFNDFNFNSDHQSPNSINLLRSSNVDFKRNRLEGVDSHWSSLLESMETFFKLVRAFFGDDWWDVKHIMKYCDTLNGGLETVAALKVQRLAGKRHQANSNYLLTCQTFLKMMKTFFPGESGKVRTGAVLFGLEMQA
ncbi:hypothetical protein J5N97_005107 [Dioscorea zingiberensis]|uniref:Uncharacterized protein n=1 Tax=Dioscorea zingiberensis TaxID=325984 RepID=A0A9D5D7I0_9LILI|nr:hypothetical protein J5N97_005107 [Dioscorea zingiberensis]